MSMAHCTETPLLLSSVCALGVIAGSGRRPVPGRSETFSGREPAAASSALEGLDENVTSTCPNLSLFRVVESLPSDSFVQLNRHRQNGGKGLRDIQ